MGSITGAEATKSDSAPATTPFNSSTFDMVSTLDTAALSTFAYLEGAFSLALFPHEDKITIIATKRASRVFILVILLIDEYL